MDHEFDLAFDLLDDAIDRLQQQQYGITTLRAPQPRRRLAAHQPAHLQQRSRPQAHPAGHLRRRRPDRGRVEVTAPDLDTDPQTRIVKVHAGDLMFHAIPGTWSFRATGHRTYIITAGVADEPIWTLTAVEPPLPPTASPSSSTRSSPPKPPSHLAGSARSGGPGPTPTTQGSAGPLFFFRKVGGGARRAIAGPATWRWPKSVAPHPFLPSAGAQP